MTFGAPSLPFAGPVDQGDEGDIGDAIALDRRKDRIDGRGQRFNISNLRLNILQKRQPSSCHCRVIGRSMRASFRDGDSMRSLPASPCKGRLS
jgi:hypothetical protein